MIIRKAFKYRLKPTRRIESKLNQFAGCCRYVWNKGLALQKELLDQKKSCLSYNKMAAFLRDWKAQPETNFLKDCHSQSLQQTLMAIDKAIKDAFDKKNPKRFPRFKKKERHDSFRYPQGFKIDDNSIYLPKIGWVRFFESREIIGTVRNVTISRRGKHWFVSIQTEQQVKSQGLISRLPMREMIFCINTVPP
jgi:putative transposase